MTTDDIVALENKAIALAEEIAKAHFGDATATPDNPGTVRDYLGTLRINLRQLSKACEAVAKELATKNAF